MRCSSGSRALRRRSRKLKMRSVVGWAVCTPYGEDGKIPGRAHPSFSICRHAGSRVRTAVTRKPSIRVKLETRAGGHVSGVKGGVSASFRHRRISTPVLSTRSMGDARRPVPCLVVATSRLANQNRPCPQRVGACGHFCWSKMRRRVPVAACLLIVSPPAVAPRPVPASARARPHRAPRAAHAHRRSAVRPSAPRCAPASSATHRARCARA